MTFSIEWDAQYSRGSQLSTWPWSDLVSYIYRYAHPNDGFEKILELGCGAGANIRLFKELGCDYWGIEGSPVIVASLHSQYPDLTDRIIVADFTQDIPIDEFFDCVVDRSSLTHNSTADISSALRMIYAKLRTGGKFIGIDWFSTDHRDSHYGTVIDAYTKNNIKEGQFKAVGRVHFSDYDHLIELLSVAGFRIERLEHKFLHALIPADNDPKAWWNFVAVKP